MVERNFMALLQAQQKDGFFACAGLDPVLAKIPEDMRNRCGVTRFLCDIVDYVGGFVGCFKPNVGFFMGLEGLQEDAPLMLRDVIRYINVSFPSKPVILDSKRGDIGKTNTGYVKELEFYGADAMTISPYLGVEAMKPFLDNKDKGFFVLCRTSNPGSNEFQGLDVSGDVVPGGYMPLYKYVAYRVANEWNYNGNCGIVFGGTYPKELIEARTTVPLLQMLVPGFGAQGAKIEHVFPEGLAFDGGGIIANSSGGIAFAYKNEKFLERYPNMGISSKPWALAAQIAAREMDTQIRGLI